MRALFPCLLAVLMLLNGLKLTGQSSYASLTLSAPPLSCGQNCTTLSATLTSGAQTTSYSVQPISYNPPNAFDTGTPILVHADDLWSSVISLPFNFCFFDSVYNKLIISDNGAVSFKVAQSGTFASWEIDTIPLGTTPVYHQTWASIMAPWQDMDNTHHGQIYYGASGTAPNRTFYISWYDIPMFGDSGSVTPIYCNQISHQTQMVALYETTNIVEIYIKNKDTLCSNLSNGSDWNSDWAVEGIQSDSGKTAFTVPGRKGTKWVAYNDAWRFVPNGLPAHTVNWFNGTTMIGTGDSLMVCPVRNSTYSVIATYNNCDGTNLSFSDSITLQPTGLIVDTALLTIPVVCGPNGAVKVLVSGGTPPVNFNWSNGITGASDTLLTSGSYSVTITDAAGCTAIRTYNIPSLLSISTDTIVNVSCNGNANGYIGISATGGNGPLRYSWSNLATSRSISGLSVGNYSVFVQDSAGCSASANYLINQPSILKIDTAIITAETCRAPACINVTATGGIAPLHYLWSNGDTLAGNCNFSAGHYQLTITDFNTCRIIATYTINAAMPNDTVIYRTICAGDNFAFNGIALTSPGIYFDTLINVHSCDSIIALHLYVSGYGPVIDIYDTTCTSNDYVYAGNVYSAPGRYNVRLTTGFGCDSSVNLNLALRTAAPDQQLCMVTIDTVINKPVIIWSKANKYATDSFFIYRATMIDSNNYVLVATVNRDSLSETIDVASHPDSNCYRYKINLINSCGYISALSNYHQTICLDIYQPGVLVWSSYIIENNPNPVVNYILYRDSIGDGNWQLLQTLSPTTNLAFDPDYLNYPNAQYRILATLNVTCNPGRSGSVVSSNLIRQMIKTPTNIRESSLSQIRLLNNPVSDQLQLINISESVTIDLMDALGQCVLCHIVNTGSSASIPVGPNASGIYFLKITAGSSSMVLKVIKY